MLWNRQINLCSRRALRSAVSFTVVIVAACGVASAATICVIPGGGFGCKPTISAAVAAASSGDVIEVAQGTYNEQVTITKTLSLVAVPFAQPVINALGHSNGIFINGMATAPLPGVSGVIVQGFKVENANYEGILVANASDVILLDNHVLNNNKKLEPSAAMCPGIAGFETSEAMDCGEGIHLMATDHAQVLRNLIENNSGGILITSETGPSTSNLVKGNNVHDNPYACGITMAGHPPANAAGPLPATAPPYPISHNVISHNQSHHNGLGLPGAGAGVGIFAPFPGTSNTANVIVGNDLYNNGLPGVTMHNHASAPPPAPGISLNDNVIIGNHIHGNAADTADAATSGPTGINIYSTAPVTGIMIEQNDFNDESINVAFHVPAGNLDVHFNDFNGNNIGVDNLGAGTVSATENWWNCVSGPGSHCSKAVGSGVSTTPWLLLPFTVNLDGY